MSRTTRPFAPRRLSTTQHNALIQSQLERAILFTEQLLIEQQLNEIKENTND